MFFTFLADLFKKCDFCAVWHCADTVSVQCDTALTPCPCSVTLRWHHQGKCAKIPRSVTLRWHRVHAVSPCADTVSAQCHPALTPCPWTPCPWTPCLWTPCPGTPCPWTPCQRTPCPWTPCPWTPCPRLQLWSRLRFEVFTGTNTRKICDTLHKRE